jgi:hypothetical protein
MTTRQLAQLAARIAAYGSATARTPADYTLLEAFEAMRKQNSTEPTKRRKGEQDVVIDDGATGPIFTQDND